MGENELPYKTYDPTARRLAAIPLESLQREINVARVTAGLPPCEPRRLAVVDMPVESEAPKIASSHTAESSMLSLGVLSSAIVCAGCVIQRYYRSLKTKVRKIPEELS